MKISNRWNNFLFGWREGTIGYLGLWLGTFGGLGTLLEGADSWWAFLMSFIYSYWIYLGFNKGTGLKDKWDKEEYSNLK